MAYIEMINSSKIYTMGSTKIYANDEINFSVEKGEFAIIVGPSGAGKSTVLNILGGMDTNDSGEVIVDGKDISKYDENELTTFRRYDVGFVFQFYNLIPNLTAKENVELASQIVEDAIDAEDILEKVGLKDRMDNFPAQLSGGEQQRVAIARALAKKPKLLLCDEPTGALDYQTGKSILKLLKETAESTNTTVVLITHNGAITPIGDRVIEIRDAKVKSMEINRNPKSIDDIEW
ncbi:MAG: ABC transporter ATP-binding protein [Tissierellia bacterium]|nr:ABC transporter ATP-binding protein [Tissierellia bacterium]